MIQNEAVEVPRLPDEFDTLPEEKQEWEREILRRRLLHYHYNLSTATFDRIHHKALVYPLNPSRRRIFIHATAMWEGETINLLYALIEMVVSWEYLAKGGAPCPVVISEDEMATADRLYQALLNADDSERKMKGIIGLGEDTWVPAARCDEAKALAQELKSLTLKALAEDPETPQEMYPVVAATWPLDDMDEEELEEYK